MNTITTAAELDALPVGSVLLDLGPDRAEADAPVIACKAADGDWWIAGTPKDRRWRADEILRDSTGSVLICAHRPDATPEPQRVQPSVEDVAKCILSAGLMADADDDAYVAEQAARAVLALLPGRPVDEVWRAAWGVGRAGIDRDESLARYMAGGE